MSTEEEKAAQLKTLRRQRGNIQGCITTLAKKLDSWKDDVENQDLDLLQQSLEFTIKKFESFESIQDQLEEIDENEISHRETFQEFFISVVARAKKTIRESNVDSDILSIKSNPSSSKSNESPVEESKISIKLPNIQLQQFDGSIENWASFYDLFTSVIKNSKLTDAGKLAYLKHSVKDKASDVIESLSTTDHNYEIALSLLKSKYDFPRRAMRKHWAILREFPKIPRDTPAALGNVVNIFQKHLKALETLGAPIQHWDLTIIDLILTKIGSYTSWQWELTLKDNTVPPHTNLLAFLEKRANSADFTSSTETDSHSRTNQKPGGKNSKFAPYYKNTPNVLVAASSTSSSNTSDAQTSACQCCQTGETHLLYRCPRFNSLSIQNRWNLVKELRLCYNCINLACPRSKNSRNSCMSKSQCRHCRRSHHSSLCSSPPAEGAVAENSKQPPASTQNVPSAPVPNAPMGLVSAATVADVDDVTSTVLLGSAQIQVRGGDGLFYTLNGLIDSAASHSFLTVAAAQKLGLRYTPNMSPEPVSGIGGGLVASGIKGNITCFVKPRDSFEPVLPTETIVIQKIVTALPTTRIPPAVKSYFSDLNLADRHFDVTKEVHFLLGADIFPYIYTGEKRFGPQGYPAALASIFGWVITGRIGPDPDAPFQKMALVATPSTDTLLCKFWELEDLPKVSRKHPDDMIAEKIYAEQHYRQPDGRYVVPIMLREDAPPLGDSKGPALRRLNAILLRLDRNPDLKIQYDNFLREYEELGHMSKVPPEKAGQADYYIPHHCVLKGDNIRVVFDASQKTNTLISLNDNVYNGEKLQNDIFDIILRFRLHQKVFTCDISKMYRQILIRPTERRFQHILWRQNGELQEYELNTVSYGVKSSPFVALRTIKQLTIDEGHRFPLAAKVIEKNIYIDDLCTGQPDTSSLLTLKNQTVGILKSAGCEAVKWASNSPELLSQVPPEHRITSLDLDDGNAHAKLLGIHWDAQKDNFYFKAQPTRHDISKRNILSHLSRIFDPLGLVAPIVFKAKTIMQKLWLQGIDWDSPVPDDLATEWTQFYEKLPAICLLKIDRCVVLPGADSHTLIGFSDASIQGYCGSVFLRSESKNGVKVSLLAAKTRVAPTKTVSIPRLELCAAKLLASLIKHVKTQLEEELTIQQVFTFTDSQVVLSWLKTIPCKLKTFEANRVTYILEKVEPSSWKFVPSLQNPSDLGSRGCHADELENHPLWLTDPIDDWPNFPPKSNRPATLLSISTNYSFWEPFISKFSNLDHLQRVTAWLLRYIQNLATTPELRVKAPSLSVNELNDSMNCLIKTIQKKHFSQEIQILEKTPDVPKKLKSLQPFIDPQGIVRVGGRLSNAKLPFQSKHPILLPKHDHLVHILIDSYHQKYLHAGPRLLQSLLARQFWILAARSVIRSRLRKCVPCFQARPTNINPLMADLPPSRVTPSKIFLEVQIDFGGPFNIREHRRRNPKIFKAYLCLFICAATKAVHLEVVSDLSSEAFLATFDRFISRRGLCRKILSDNATNFTGANRHLNEVYAFLASNKQQIDDHLSTKGIEWSFIPPKGPHFGGLHEAGIKSAKYHLKRTVGAQTLTFEEMSTVFTKVEAIMNSRPLCQISTDAAEVDVLTPGHFLVGGPLVAVPEYNWEDINQNRLSRWQMLQKLTQHFWRVWSRDYIHTLIQRSKWQHNQDNLQIGAVVIIEDDTAPPTQWKKGVIEQTHPGRDGVVRVVTVRTATGSFKRPAVKIYPLPKQ